MFVILAHQRSGTHLLASLLDSHPDLRCYDEVFIKNKKKTPLGVKNIKKLGEHEGCIIMYSQLLKEVEKEEGLLQQLNKAKIIHLKREDRAKHLKSLFRKRGVKYNKGYAIKVSHYIDSLEKKVFRYNFQKVFTTTYEEICRDKNVREYENKKLLKFLGVKPMKLTTQLKKGEN